MSETIATPSAGYGSRRRIWAAAITTLAILTAAVTAGLLSSPEGGTPVIFVERISSQISQIASGPVSSLWWAYAFLLGVVAAFNPCGFAVLPAYLGRPFSEAAQFGRHVARVGLSHGRGPSRCMYPRSSRPSRSAPSPEPSTAGNRYLRNG